MKYTDSMTRKNMGCRILENDLKGMYFRQIVTLSMMKDSQS